MASLTYTAYLVRKSVKYGALLVLIIGLGRGMLLAGVQAWEKAHPEPPAPPDTKFGKLPPVLFGESATASDQFYLETVDGGLPKTSDRIKVYFSPQISTKFLALDMAKKRAAGLAFPQEPEKLKEDEYVFRNAVNSTSLTINVLTGNFYFTYPYLNDQTLINPNTLPSNSEAINLSLGFLDKAGVGNDDLKMGEKKISYWKIKPDGLTEVSSPSEADLIRVSFLRLPIVDGSETYKILGPKVKEAGVTVLVSGSDMDSKRIVEAKFNYLPVDREQFATYPLKTAQTAWDNLIHKEGYVANSKGGRMAIRRVYLAYFEPNMATNFLMPIYVFEGDGETSAFVSAIEDRWVEKGN